MYFREALDFGPVIGQLVSLDDTVDGLNSGHPAFRYQMSQGWARKGF